MALRTCVKVNRVNNLSDARYCAGMGAQLMGFNVTPGDDECIAPELFNAISEWISGVEFVAEVYGNEIPDLSSYSGFTYIQINNPGLIHDALKSGLEVIYLIDLDLTSDSEIKPMMDRLELDIKYFLLESKVELLDGILYQTIKGLSERFSILLGFGFDKGNLNAFIDKLPLKGIAMNGGEEVRPGYRDFDEMADILELLEDEDL